VKPESRETSGERCSRQKEAEKKSSVKTGKPVRGAGEQRECSE